MLALVGAADVIPTTKAAPLLESVPIVLPDTVDVVPEEPMLIPVTELAPLIFVMVLPLSVLPFPPPPPPKLQVIAVTELVPPVQLLKVLFVKFLFAVPPSVLFHPAIVVAPVTVILEKLLLF